MIDVVFEDGKYKVKLNGVFEYDKARSIQEVQESFDTDIAYEFNEAVRHAFMINGSYLKNKKENHE
ncbi:hypothetical protein KQI61_06060 [Anaerocolumna aminovalerica]|uniref:hypothetical protein n=1 Tax=Anaerocolumna aminovalerica TaxID=1527 RepID=UPI001C0EC59B|nr:hypothetical protein [Anaerocolumna aminovalerica]MBU5331755.1 hypothetical protein [Anaerocolumna aminovalerica]